MCWSGAARAVEGSLGKEWNEGVKSKDTVRLSEWHANRNRYRKPERQA